ncbi:internal scaffolding protein [robinz microvirus RP_93]|nr:internal scaffolding protein [robinz microvirus RP_93]
MAVSTFPQAVHDWYGSNGSNTVVFNREPSLTRQEFAEECDINTLMKRYDAHVIGGPGNLPPVEPMYVDFAEMPQDLMGYLKFMEEAEASFMRLPAVVRKEFDNSAMEFIGFASDPGNLGQMRDWGLAPPAKVPDASAAVKAPESAPPPAASPGPS